MAGDSPSSRIARLGREFRGGLWRPALFGLLFALLFLPQIVYLITVVWEEERYSHGFLIPLVSLGYVYLNRDRFAKVRPRPSNAALALIVLGLAAWLTAQAGTFNALAHLSMLLVLGGLVAAAAGWRALRLSAFPILYLVFAFPVPKQLDKLYVVGPLQTFASIVSRGVIDLMGIPVGRHGNVIEVPNMELAVEEACSGINSLYSLMALGAAYVFLTERSTRERVTLLAATIPIAIVANVFRVSMTGVLAVWVSPNAADGFFHTFSGLVVFLLGLAIFLLFAVFIRWLGEPDSEPPPAEE